MKKALLIQQLPDGKIVILATEAQEVIHLSDLIAIRPEAKNYEYPASDNVFGVICDYFKPTPPPDPRVNPT